MAIVTLESRLRDYAREDPEQYESLLTTWLHNKKRCASLLSSVSEYFMYYSSHSAEHSKTVIRNIERILGDNRIQLFSATDIWLILHASYMHDLGMVISDEEYRAIWRKGNEEHDRFERFLNDALSSPNPDLRKASQFLKEIIPKTETWEKRKKDGNDGKAEINEDWPVAYRSAAAILISEFFRPKHAQRIEKYVDYPHENGKLSFDNVNNSRIVNLIKRVSCLHTQDSQELLKLERETVGFGRDIAHPRFVAELLRLGDALDLDAGRFSIDFTFLRGKRPEYSELHWKLHKATRDFLIKPEKVVYRADCEDRNTYRLIRQLTGYLEEEFRFCALNWAKIVPDDFPGPVPQFLFSESDVTINGKPDAQGLTGLRFTLSERKAFQLLEGANIYDDPMTFVRELLQNALDASKIQLWRDLNARYDYRRRLPEGLPDNLSALQPYDIPPDLLENYPIHIQIREIDRDKAKCPQTGEESWDGEETTEIVFTDYGTGFTVDSVKRMCQVTESYSDPKIAGEIDKMPLWLRPTGGFGIGLQSVFAKADMISVDTQSDDGTHLKMEIDSPRKKNGEVRVDIQAKPRPGGRGSTTTIRLKGEAKERFDFDTFETSVTPYGGQLYGKIEDFLAKQCRSPLFPITATWKDKSCSPPGMSFYELFRGELPGYDKSESFEDKNNPDRNHYYYRLSGDGTQMEIWDTKGAWLAHWELSHSSGGVKQFSHFFKGMSVNINFYEKGFYGRYRIDAYGLDADENLQLNRRALKRDGAESFFDALRKTQELYLEILWKRAQSALKLSTDTPGLLVRRNSASSETLLDKRSDGCYHLAFWLSAPEDVRRKLSEKYSAWFKDKGIRPKCLEIRPDSCEVQDMPAEEYIHNYATLPRLSFMYSRSVENDAVGAATALRAMDAPYNQCERVLLPNIALSEKSARSNYTMERLPEFTANIGAVCYALSADKTICVYFPANAHSKEKADVLDVNQLAHWEIMQENFPTHRCALPVLNGYQSLALDRQGESENLSRVDVYFDFPNQKIVISPIAPDDNDAIRRKSKEDFLKYLPETKPFQALVRYVAKHTTQGVSEADIAELYLKLAGEIWEARHQPRPDAETVTEGDTEPATVTNDAAEPAPVSDDTHDEKGETLS